VRQDQLRKNIVRKSVAYITFQERVLFFRADELPELGAELPGGTLLPDEDPEEGLLREILEETGLRDLGPPRLLGVIEHDPEDGSGEIHRRHFFHMALEAPAPDSWSRVVEEGNGTFTFRFFWSAPQAPPPKVYPGHDVFLGEVADILAGP
jgi:ADP-ribose pyrophosphatase YjhB (NUDIX family)